MLKINVLLDNMTTDEETIELQLPLDEPDIKSKLMRDCDYLVMVTDSGLSFESDEIFTINNIVNIINYENPSVDNNVICHILDATNITNIDDEEILESICNNDFMYDEVEIPIGWKGTEEEYAAYYLSSELEIPFSIYETEFDTDKIGMNYDELDSIWDVYSFMGFGISIDETDDKKIYIVNIECSEF